MGWRFDRIESLATGMFTFPYPDLSGSHTFSLTATAKIEPDTNSLTFVLVTARF